jgi:signal transduction histidine kinase
MNAWIKTFLKSPLVQPPDQDQVTKMLRAVFIFGFPVSFLGLLVGLLDLIDNPSSYIFIYSMVLMTLLISLTFYLRGNYLGSSVTLIVLSGAFLTSAYIFYLGTHSVVVSGYLIIILLAAQLLGWKAGFITFILSAISSSLVIFLTQKGYLPAISYQPGPFDEWLSNMIIFIWVMYLVYHGSHSLNLVLKQADKTRQELLKSQQEQLNAQVELVSYSKDLERRIVQLQVAAEIARDAASLQEVNELLDRAVNLIRERFGFYHAGIFLIDERREYAVLQSASGEAGKRMIAQGHKLKIGEVGIVGYVTGTGRPRIVLDVGKDRAYYPNPLLPETRSELTLALISGGVVIGALDVQSREAGAFNEDDVAILQTMADQIAIAITNARLFTATRRQLEELSAIHAVVTAGVQATSEDDLIERATQIIANAFYPDNFGVLMMDENKKYLYHHPSYHEKHTISHPNIPLGMGIVGTVALTGQPKRIGDVTKEPAYLTYDPDTISELVVPMKIGERVIGVINTESKQPDNFTENDERLLTTFAGQLAIGIETIRLDKATRQRLAELEAIRQASMHMNTILDLKLLLEVLLEQATQLIEADTAHLFLYNDGILTFGTAYWKPGFPQELHAEPRPGGVTYTVARRGTRMVIDDARNHPMFRDAPWDGAVASLPLRRGDQVLGVMNLAHHGSAYEFNQNELRVMELFADQAAIALYNAKLYTDSQERAYLLAQTLAQREELDRLKSEFIQNVSHELRTPLAITRGYIDLLQNNELGELTKEQQDAIDILSRRINLLIKLVDDLVVILQAEANDLVKQDVNLNEILRTCIEDFQETIDRAGLTVEVNLPREAVIIQGDDSHLNRMIDNLIGNATKFTQPNGRIAVRLRTEADQAVIEVSDNGIGIAPEKIDRIFDRFYQVDGSTRRRFGGIGLGLSLVKGIVEAHAGTISVQSQPGEGTTFTITFPLVMKDNKITS